jgi:hypothetical protein
MEYVAGFWYVIEDVRAENWPYIAVKARLGPYANRVAAELHCLSSVGERVKFWDGQTWKDSDR